MKTPVFRSLWYIGVWALAALSPVSAQPAPAAAAPLEVAVTNVKFGLVRVPNSSGGWYETDIELAIKPSVPSERFVNRVRVVLNLGIELTAPRKGIDLYRASAEIVTLEQGKANVRFYLPPEVVRRDGISGNSKYYTVEVSVGDKLQVQPANGENLALVFRPEGAAKNFQSKVASEAGARDGVLIPQYLTPYAYDSSRPSPSFVRVEPAR